MEYLTLNNGVEMPKLGLGVFRVTDLQEAEQTVVHAITRKTPNPNFGISTPLFNVKYSIDSRP